jgi:hypothetical protein
MAENTSPTLAPEKPAVDVAGLLPQTSVPASLNSEKKALFDSITHESDPTDEAESSTLKTFFTRLLWLGYATAVMVAVALVWSAAGSLLKSFAR